MVSIDPLGLVIGEDHPHRHWRAPPNQADPRLTRWMKPRFSLGLIPHLIGRSANDPFDFCATHAYSNARRVIRRKPGRPRRPDPQQCQYYQYRNAEGDDLLVFSKFAD